MFAPIFITAAVMIGLDRALSGTITDTTVDLDSKERFNAKHANETGAVPGDVVNGMVTGGDGTQYRYLFSIDGERVFRNAASERGNVWIISNVPGIQPILWGVAAPSSVNGLDPSDIVRATGSPQAVYTSRGTLKGYVANGVFSAGQASGQRGS